LLKATGLEQVTKEEPSRLHVVEAACDRVNAKAAVVAAVVSAVSS
jgi:hypothetical protein